MAEWRVDYSANLHYKSATTSPPAPFGLSTSPDFVTSFPVRVDSFKRDFTNPINRCFVRGGYITGTGTLAVAEYKDPVSIQQYGEFSSAIVDDSITDPYDAQLRAQSTVLKYAYPIEQGSFTIWKDGLEVGMRVRITEEALGIDGEYVIRSMSMEWKDPFTVEYKANFGAAQADLESFLRIIDARTRWKTSNPTSGVPLPGSVTDSSIASSGLHEQVIKSVSAGTVTGSLQAHQIGSVQATTILGLIQAGQIGTVAASTIQGLIDAGQIGSVNAGIIVGAIQANQIGTVGATSIQGAIQAGQIGTVNATSIQGVVVSSQLADKIIDDLAKYADALRPVQIFDTPPPMPNANLPGNSFWYYTVNGHFYKVRSDGSWYDDAGTDPDALSGSMKFYHIGKLAAKTITGLIVAAQIQDITAGQITGAIQANQISTVNASSVQGSLSASQIGTVNASAIVGSIQSSQIAAIAADKITGTITAGQIGSINANQIATAIQGSQIAAIKASTITIGLIGSGQIGSVDAGTITVGKINSDQLNSTEIMVGGGGSKPGKLTVRDGSNSTIAELGTLTGGSFGGWFKVFGAGGTGYSTAKVYTDTSGNLYVKDAYFSVAASGSTINASPATFDSTYSSLAVEVVTGSDKAKLISRGLAVWNGSNYVVTANRSPTTANCGEVVVYKAGTIMITLDGVTGRARADGGFQCGIYVGSGTSTTPVVVTISGVTMRFVGGLYVGS